MLHMNKDYTISGQLNKLLLVLSTLLILFSFSSCGSFDRNEVDDSDNTVTGVTELSKRINREAQNGKEEVTLYVKGVTEKEIQNIPSKMNLFWGDPTEYSILSKDNKNVYKTKFIIEKSNNYYVVQNYINNEKIPDDKKEAKEILQELKSMIKSTVDDKMSDYNKELAIHDWLVAKIKYDEGIDSLSTENGSYGAMVDKKTMCRGYAEAMKLISECCNLESEIVIGSAIDQNNEEVPHAWNMIKLDGKWYHMDATYDDPINNQTGNIYHFYFNLNDEDISKTHTWERDFFPVADNDSYMYYKRSGSYYSNYDEFKDEIQNTIRTKKPAFLEVLLDEKNVNKNQLQFIFSDPDIKTISWSTHGSDPVVVTLRPSYK